MTCSTCHDVHETERDARQLSMRCVACHAPAPGKPNVTAALPETHSAMAVSGDSCVDCHMPLQPSRLIRIAEERGTLAPSYRTHHIAVYPRTSNADAPAAGGSGQ